MHVRVPGWWGKPGWHRVNRVDKPIYHGMVGILVEGGRWMLVGPRVEVQAREELVRG